MMCVFVCVCVCVCGCTTYYMFRCFLDRWLFGRSIDTFICTRDMFGSRYLFKCTSDMFSSTIDMFRRFLYRWVVVPWICLYAPEICLVVGLFSCTIDIFNYYYHHMTTRGWPYHALRRSRIFVLLWCKIVALDSYIK